MLPILLFPLFLSILSLTQLVNISHMAGLNDDFSNLVLQVVNENGTTTVPYTIVDMQDGQWAMVNATLPEGNGTLVASASQDYSDNWTENQTANAGNVTIQQMNDYSSGYADNETSSNSSALENGTGVPPGYEDIDEFLNQSNATINSSTGYANVSPPLNATNISMNSSGVPSGYEDIDEFINQSNATVNGTANLSTGYVNIDVFLNATNQTSPGQAQSGSFEAISAGSHKHGSTELIQLSYNGSQAEMSADAYDMLADNASVRLIVEGGNGFSQYGQNISVIKTIASRELRVVMIDKRSLALLLQAGASKIYLDTPVQALLNDSIPLIRADEAAKDFNLSGQGIAICLLDTGVDYNESQFGGQVLQGYDFVDNVSDAMDDNGHGTLMASIIHSIAPDATIIPVKVLDSTGLGYSSDIIQGIDYCMQAGQNVRIISMSFGGGNFTNYCDSDPLAMAVEDAYDAGILPVSSSGNGGGAAITLPACAMNATAVASTTDSDTVSSFSSINGMVSLLAPGENIAAEGMDGQEILSGTSVSAAEVSGAAALLMESNSSLGPAGITQVFRTTGIPIQYGGVTYPRIDVFNAVMGNVTGNPVSPPMNESNGTGISNFSAAIWSNTTFSSCRNITIINAGASALTNFPAFINITNTTDMASNYFDLRFYNASCNNGGTLLPYEIENYTASNATVWVGVNLSVGNTIISVYFKNTSGVSSGQNPTAVWDSNFMGVWHMNNVNPKDSTSNGNNGTGTGDTEISNGEIDGEIGFAGGNASYINCSNSSTLHSGSQLTIEAWTNSSATLATNPKILAKGFTANSGVFYEYALSLVSSGGERYDFQLTTNGTGTAALTQLYSVTTESANAWHQIVGTYNGSLIAIYVDGKLDNSTALNGTISNYGMPLIIGSYGNNLTASWNGTLDEVRVSSTARSAQWINQSYQMELNNSKWVKFGSEQTQPTVSVTLNSPANSSFLNSTTVNFNWTCSGSSSNYTANLTVDTTVYAISSSSNNSTATNYSVTGLTQGAHTWNVICIDPLNNSISSATWNFTVDTTPPNIALNSPANASLSNTGNVTFNFTATDNLALTMNCSIYLDGVSNQTNSSVNNNTATTFNITGIADGAHTWYVSCKDNANNTNTSATWNFSVQRNCPVISASGTETVLANLVGAPNNASPLSNFTCVKIAASNVTLNCNGFNITNNATNGTTYGVLLNGSISNVTIENCPGVSNYTYGIYIYNSNNSNIINSKAFNDSLVGMDFNSSSNDTITNSSGFSASGFGFYLNATINSRFVNVTASSTSGYGVYIQSSANFTIINSTGSSSSQAGIVLASSSNFTIINSTGSSNTSYGFFLNQSNSDNFTGDNASNDFFGFYLANSSSNQFSNNTAANDTNTGLSMDSLSSSNNFTSNTFCFNNVTDINNSGASNSGSLDACGYWSNWSENGHAGCAYSCSLVWQEFFGNITGKQFLAPNNSQALYSWKWNGSSGEVFVFNSGVSISWANITAIGRNTTGGSSTTDFTTLDTLLSMTGSPDNITGLYSTSGTPKTTVNMTIYGRPVPYVPLANSSSASSNSTSTTGILWDDSTNTGGHFASGSNVIFVTQINNTAANEYDIRVPSHLSTYGSASGMVQFWVEMD
jgi:parallel beta-helix repeat protein